MKTLRRGDKGDEVTYAQERLMAKGYELPKYGADGDFGGETEQQVERMQAAHSLTIDGIIGQQTWTLLLSETSARPPENLTTSEKDRLKALAREGVERGLELGTYSEERAVAVLAALDYGIDHLDCKEIPDGSNWGDEIAPFVRNYNDYWNVDTSMYGRMAWCSMFATTCVAVALGLPNNPVWGQWRGHPLFPTGKSGGAWLGGVKQVEAWGQEHHAAQMAPIAEIPTGAFFTIGRAGSGSDPGGAQHIGLVVRDNGDDTYTTIEGNVSNAIKSYTRKKDTLRWVVRWWEGL